jgi:L-asparaginase
MSPAQKSSLHIIITGGTIDSYYDGTKDTVVPRKQSIVPQYCHNLHLSDKPRFSTVCMKDSRHLTTRDVSSVLRLIEKSPEKKIIVTHGTYTIPDTARYLRRHLRRRDCTVVLTGSMEPIDFALSDGGFNLGFAFAQVSVLPPGVYVCMNGRVFDPDDVIKIIYEGRFSSLMGESSSRPQTGKK